MILALALLFATPAENPPPKPEDKPQVFAVSKVDKATKPLATLPAKELLREAGGDAFEAAAEVGNLAWLDPKVPALNGHPFVAAAHLAFAEHRPLALSPDMIWLLINQMAAREVLADPEKYRGVFAAHAEGQRTLIVRRDEFTPGSPANDWPGVFAEFEDKIVKQAPSPIPATFSHPFSSSRPWEIAARRVTLLKTASPYFKYKLHTFCGIPEIELSGSPEDWRWIRKNVEGFAALGMKRRVAALLPVLDQFIAASEGKADAGFWQSFYKYDSESGGSYVSGWINLFFIEEKSPVLDKVLTKTFRWSGAKLEQSRGGALNLPIAMEPNQYPKGLLEQEFIWNISLKGIEENRPMLLRAGFLGISQDPQSLTLKPQIAWQVLLVKESPWQRELRAHLRPYERIDGKAISDINAMLIFDEATASCKWNDNTLLTQDSQLEIWLQVIPLLSHTESINLDKLFPIFNNHRANNIPPGPDDSSPEICRQLLALPRLKTIKLPKNFDPECRRILETRTDWKLETAP
ncbi:MAG: hypothetical protein RL095_1970 [Verrucomicrobiota bacterium]|jgi:hypothetical protein